MLFDASGPVPPVPMSPLPLPLPPAMTPPPPEEADDAERPTPPMLPLMPRGMHAWTPTRRTPMPGSGGSSEEREPGAAVCAPAPNFELLCVVYSMASM